MKIGNRAKFIDYWSRANTGEICFVDEFDKKVFWPKLKEITKRYDIRYDPSKQVPTDDDMLDRLWQAGIDLVLEVGVLCPETRRLMQFTRKEIEDTCYNCSDTVTVGSGKDQVVMKHRGFEDYDHLTNPVCVLGRILGPASAECYHAIALSFAQVSEMDMCHFQGNLTEIYGQSIVPGSPWEMMAEMWCIAQIKDACRQVCRPGLSDGGIRCIDLAAIQSIMDPGWGMGKGDFRCCLTLPFNKAELKHMTRALTYNVYGVPFYSVMTSYPGGLSGGPTQSAVVGVGEWIIEKLLFDVQLNGSWSADAMYFSNTSKYALWCSNYQNAAVTRNTHCEPLVGGGYQMTHGIGHENFFWESAASAISATVLGNGVSGGTGCQSGKMDHQCGFGLQFSVDCGKAVAKARMTREQANDIVCQCMAKYQPNIDARIAHTLGCDFKGCYDLRTVKPQKWYVDLGNKVRKELNQMGLPIDYD